MKAWQYEGTNKPLTLAEIDEPEPGLGEVLISVKAAGLCHSDVGALTDKAWEPLLTKRPVTMGHEISGVITALGDGVTGWRVGDNVGVCPTGPSGISPGYGRDGGWQKLTVQPASDLVKMPDHLSFEVDTVGTDAGMTSYHALVTVGDIRYMDRVGIIGIGGLGQIAAQAAVRMGAEVYVAEINEDAWPLAYAWGAKEVQPSIQDFAGYDLDLIVDYVGAGSTTAGSIYAIRPGGKIVLVGMGILKADINTRDLILKHAQILGSTGGTMHDVEACYRLFSNGAVNPVMKKISFDKIPESLELLHQRKARGRLVCMFE
ncbi:MAG: zinc-binding dehydrogenase [Propionibacteriaceae bacterium]|jgi:propanol-preferring alcohol dehydrogenase|nr:zinc-binding dehydrogenase [Propionibacteriaceae bacterium]